MEGRVAGGAGTIGIIHADVRAFIAVDAEKKTGPRIVMDPIKMKVAAVLHIDHRRGIAGDQANIFKRNSLRVDDRGALLRLQHHIIEINILYVHFRQTTHKYTFFGPIADNMTDMNVPELRCSFGDGWDIHPRLPVIDVRNGRGLCKIIPIEKNGLVDDIAHGDILHIDLFHNAAPAPDGFEAEPDIGADERTVINENIPRAARHLAADDESAMRAVHDIVADDHILGRPPAFPTFFIPSRFDANAVVARVEGALLDENAPAGFHVDAVAVGGIPGVPYMDIADR